MRQPDRHLIAFAIAVAVSFSLAFDCAAFDCAPTTCKQIKTCAEAHYKLSVCGHSDRDRDNDGIPCEDLCGKGSRHLSRPVRGPTKALGPGRRKRRQRQRAERHSQAARCCTPNAQPHPSSHAPAKYRERRARRPRSICSPVVSKVSFRDHDGVPCNSLCR